MLFKGAIQHEVFGAGLQRRCLLGAGPYWTESWNEREEMNTLIYLIRGGGRNILINTGPSQEEQLPQNILRSQGTCDYQWLLFSIELESSLFLK
jgi:hypothetical protein